MRSLLRTHIYSYVMNDVFFLLLHLLHYFHFTTLTYYLDSFILFFLFYVVFATYAFMLSCFCLIFYIVLTSLYHLHTFVSCVLVFIFYSFHLTACFTRLLSLHYICLIRSSVPFLSHVIWISFLLFHGFHLFAYYVSHDLGQVNMYPILPHNTCSSFL